MSNVQCVAVKFSECFYCTT